MSYEVLDRVNSLSDLKNLDKRNIEPLCDDIRSFLLDKVERSGGHLASNLGVVELTVAIHRIFNSPDDHIIFDVGHQAYVHKILTGRKNRFDELRKPGGLSGFTLMKESEHDAFGAGHSSTSISAALGYAESDKINNKDNYTVCVIGDGAYTGGMVHEAINNCRSDLKLVIILNENGMSISSNKGAFASYLSRVRMSTGYIGVKTKTQSALDALPLLGKPISFLLSGIKKGIKKVFFKTNYFEDLGLYYLGPIDGNDYSKVEKALQKAKKLNKCVLIHTKTVKGKGFDKAEESPDVFHSLASGGHSASTFHSVFADKLLSLAESDEKITAITAAMGLGTGLYAFEKKFPQRYFDVGIAEEHALTFAAGLAASGMKPFSAIYSTFLQRGYDNIIHDIALQNLPVKLFIDRAGLAPSDGATHHGIFDVAFLSHIPNIEIYAPIGYESLESAVDYASGADKPVAVRYPNSSENEKIVGYFNERMRGEKLNFKFDFDPTQPPERILISYGQISSVILEAKKILEEKGIICGIIIVEKIKPYYDIINFLSSVLTKNSRVVYLEEGIKNGGAAMITQSRLFERGVECARFDICAIDDNFVIPTELCNIYDFIGFTADKLAGYFLN